jgi:hypothetical protein
LFWWQLKLDQLRQSSDLDFNRRPQHSEFQDRNTILSYNDCHEQPHHGICKAFDDARGSQPSHGYHIENHAHLYAYFQLPRSFLDNWSSRRYPFWTSTCWLPVTKTREMGSEQGIDVGQGRKILPFDRDGEGNVRRVGAILQTSVSLAIEPRN